jgi:hypothetical protein
MFLCDQVISYVVHVRMWISYQLQCRYDDMKNKKNTDIDAAIYNILINFYKNIK